MNEKVWVLWSERGGVLGAYNESSTPKLGAPVGMQWEYIRVRPAFWRGTCGGKEAGCALHDVVIHSTWYIQQYPITDQRRKKSALRT